MTQNLTLVQNPFGQVAHRPEAGAAALSDQQRQIAEIQTRMVLAKSSPRDMVQCFDRIINACTRPGLAEAAIYQYSRGGSDINGPSIRLAEAIAQEWGNFEFGFRELSRGSSADGVTHSDVEAYAWDLERNSRRALTFRVRHWRDTKKGGYRLSDERDIYELVANQSQRRVRACILSLIPGDVIEGAVNQVGITLTAHADTSPEGLQKVLDAFGKFGVTKQQIEKRIQRRFDTITPAQIVSLKSIYASLRDGMSGIDDWFEPAEQPAKKPASNPEQARSSRADQAREALQRKKGQPKQDPPKAQSRPEQKTEQDIDEKGRLFQAIEAARTIADLEAIEVAIFKLPNQHDQSILTDAMVAKAEEITQQI